MGPYWQSDDGAITVYHARIEDVLQDLRQNYRVETVHRTRGIPQDVEVLYAGLDKPKPKSPLGRTLKSDSQSLRAEIHPDARHAG